MDVAAHQPIFLAQGWIDHYTHKTTDKPPNDNAWTEPSIREPLINSFKDNCGYCGRKMGRLPSDRPVGQVDHFLSKSKRPDLVYTWENYIWSCSDCNKGKLAKDEFLSPCNWADMEYLHFDFATGKYILKEEFRSDPQVLRKFESIQTSTLMNDSGRGKDRKKIFGEIQYSISEIKKIIGKIDNVQDADYRNCLLDSFKVQYNNLNENINREEKAYWFLRKKIIRYICKKERINLTKLLFESRS